MIRAYIGLLGQGKTLSMVNDAIPDLIKRRKIITNVPFQWPDYKKHFLHPFVRLPPTNGDGFLRPIYLNGKDFEKAILTERDALFLIDEASIVFPSYFWEKLSGNYLLRFAQARKFGMDIYYTSQGYTHTIRRLRDLTNEVVKCEMTSFFGIKMISNIIYDPEYFNFRVMTNTDMEKKFVLGRKFISRSQQKKLWKAYDTMFTVETSALTEIDKYDSKTDNSQIYDTF